MAANYGARRRLSSILRAMAGDLRWPAINRTKLPVLQTLQPDWLFSHLPCRQGHTISPSEPADRQSPPQRLTPADGCNCHKDWIIPALEACRKFGATTIPPPPIGGRAFFFNVIAIKISRRAPLRQLQEFPRLMQKLFCAVVKQ
jgi:hypothetical protein